MNLHTFKNVVDAKKASLAHDLDDDDEEGEVGAFRGAVDGEEDEGEDKVSNFNFNTATYLHVFTTSHFTYKIYFIVKFNDAGEVIEPFNLRDERDSGHFDENMNFVFKKDKGEIDAWLADMDEAAMEKGIGEAAKASRVRSFVVNMMNGALI